MIVAGIKLTIKTSNHIDLSRKRTPVLYPEYQKMPDCMCSLKPGVPDCQVLPPSLSSNLLQGVAGIFHSLLQISSAQPLGCPSHCRLFLWNSVILVTQSFFLSVLYSLAPGSPLSPPPSPHMARLRDLSILDSSRCPCLRLCSPSHLQ